MEQTPKVEVMGAEVVIYVGEQWDEVSIDLTPAMLKLLIKGAGLHITRLDEQGAEIEAVPDELIEKYVLPKVPGFSFQGPDARPASGI